MNPANAKTIFAISCLLCLVAIATGAVLEIVRQQRGESLLRPSQFRLRILSALIWMIALGSMAFAVTFLWPERGNDVAARKFLSVLSGALSLVFFAVILLAYDLWQVARERRVREAQFNLQLADMALHEIEKARAAHPAAPETSSASAESNSEKAGDTP
jgi:hypothetical protein